ncbi:MAG: endonuclease MutS2 [Lachnospiraceae bacterium]
MNEKVLKTLEFDKMILKLTEYAASDAGKELCRNCQPSYNLPLIQEQQTQTKDALTRIYRRGSLSFSGIYDIGAPLKRLEIGGVLNILELLRVCSLLDVAKRAKSYARGEREDDSKDSLADLFESLQPLTPVSDEIRRCILTEDEIADDASANLKSIRRSIRNTNEKIRNQMNSMLNNQDTRGHLQDNVITMRNGRYCLPVKSDAKGQIPGMIHDQSATGSTFFIEPMAVVKLNNDLTELAIKEQAEIDVILSTLSNLVGEQVDALRFDYRTLIQLDFIFAKAALAKEYNGVAPIFNTNGIIRIRQGRHPLLDKKRVVPIDIHLGDSFDQLIITGPNTGGKTVSLKTVGLLTLMGQAGLHIPAGDRSELTLFEEVFADIGDEQSIEQNLSTFSSHMTNITRILHQVTEHSLVLFDELCAGTDPTEGAALAAAILSDLNGRGVKSMATTHYSEIKIYALTGHRVENACCEFNVETLSPTYRLLIGIPGKSNAFAISGKLGLPDYLIQDAKNRLNQESERFEDVLAKLEENRVAIEKERLDIELHQKEIKALRNQLAAKQEDLTTQREHLVQEASEKAHRILREAKEMADETIRNFQKYTSDSTAIRQMEEERTKLREKMNEAEKSIFIKQQVAPEARKKPLKLHIGDSVTVHSLNLNGTVHTLPNAKGDLYVQMGILRSLVNVSDLSLLAEPAVKGVSYAKSGTGKIKMSKSASVSSEINLIGHSVDEAISMLDKYLDDAYLAHMPSVRIVHGKGTGALRNAVHDYLKRQTYVKQYHPGAFGEGDAGVTIAEFK